MARTRNAVNVRRKAADAHSANAAFPCSDMPGWCMGTADFYAWNGQNPILAPGHAATALWPNHTTKATAVQYMFPVPNGENLDQCGNHNYAVRRRAYVYSPSRSTTALNVNAGANGELTSVGNANGAVTVVIEFDEYVDMQFSAQSFSGGNERLIFNQNVDEFFPGGGSIWGRVSDYGNGIVWHNNNNAANSYFRFRRTKKVTFSYGKQSNLGSTMAWDFLYYYGLVKRVRCDVRPPFAPGEKATRIEEGHARVTDAIPDFFPMLSATLAGWEYSTNAGVAWVPLNNRQQQHVATAAGTIRWRKTFTIPDGLRGALHTWISGDKFDTGQPGGTAYLDGVLIDGNTENNTVKHWIIPFPIVPGVHVFEWRESATTANQYTTLDIGADYTLVLQACRKVYKVTRTDLANVDAIEYYDESGAVTIIAPNEIWETGSCKGDLL